MTQRITRRTFVKGTAATAAFAGMAAMAGCTSESKTETTADDKQTDAPKSKYDNTISADTEDLNIVLLGKDSKIAAIILALKKGYYEEEKLNGRLPRGNACALQRHRRRAPLRLHPFLHLYRTGR